ncbi:HPP family protein [Oceanicoccus sp. KOV_DT_Chl]|uniref:CBS domain-containing protein n=1 Tax=Oceanicoccus sp. KOV_DT_Chl TaxID=1904639 RepID=UPI000C7C5481|nr:CBS domain-containing protein [Oceanicoccus sp. KOV_DT_Chl]
MFYIYTPTGRSFSGSLEKLRRTEKPSPYFSSRSIEQDPLDQATAAINLEQPTSEYKVSQNALDAYQLFLNKKEHREPIKQAYQIMTAPVRSLSSTTSIQQAWLVFQQHNHQVMPIINEFRTLVGAFSRKRLYEHLLSNNLSASQQPGSVMKLINETDNKIISAAPVTDVRRIASALVDYQLDAVPIVEDDGQVVGIVSRTDILASATIDPPLSLWC